MANKIRVDTSDLERWSSKLAEVSEALTEAAEALGRVDTDDDWWRKVRVKESFRLRDEGGSVSLSSARSAVSQLERTLERYQQRVNKLSNAVKKAGVDFANTESDVRSLIEGADGAAKAQVYSEASAKQEEKDSIKTVQTAYMAGSEVQGESETFHLDGGDVLLGLMGMNVASAATVGGKRVTKTDWQQVWTDDNSEIAKYSVSVDSGLKEGKKASVTLELDAVYGGNEIFNVFGWDDIADAGRKAKYEISYHNGSRWITQQVEVGGAGHRSVKLEFEKAGNYQISVRCIENGVINETFEIGKAFDSTQASTRIRVKKSKNCSINS